jgi:hypothetical protein
MTSVSAASKINCSITAAHTTLKRIFTSQVNSATKSMMLFNAVSKANAIGAIIGVITAAATAFALFRKRSNEASDAMKAARETYSSFYAQERTQLDTIFAKLKQTNPKSEERKRLVKELADLYPELNKQTLNDITNPNNLAAAYDTLIANIRKKAWAKSKEAALEAAYTSGDKGEALLRTLFPNITEKELISKANYYIKRAETVGGVTAKTQYGEVNFGGTTGRGNVKELKNLVKSRKEAEQISNQIGSETFLGTGTGGNNTTNTASNNYTSTASDAITGGGKQVKNFYINIENLIGENTNQFSSSKDNPASAQDFMAMMSEALQKVVNDVNYAA